MIKEETGHDGVSRQGWRNSLGRFFRSQDGAAAIEFAILSLPYFLIVIAILETFIAFTGEQVISNATDTFGRAFRTGRITYNLGRATDKTQAQFRQDFCNEIAILIKCSGTEVATPAKLYIDIQNFASFSAIPTTIPRVSNDTYADIDTTKFKYSPGGPGTINMMRAYYRWQIMTDLVRPYLTTIRPAGGGMPTDFLIISSNIYQNERYP